jgi:hypothetical protein
LYGSQELPGPFSIQSHFILEQFFYRSSGVFFM